MALTYFWRMNKIEHIGIAVANAGNAQKVFDLLLGEPAYKSEMVEREAVNTVFYALGPNKLELLEPTTEESVIHRFISKKGEGIHHIAIAVDDIFAEMKRLKEHGFNLLSDEPKKGADNKLICFIHPASTNGVLIELCMDAPDGREKS
jgi:methylmalonyl-CoA/ethylmalonyl-CoA epimerase